MKQHLRLMAVLCACSMLLLTGCQGSEGFKPSADGTWGELCRQFQPEWFESIPQEMQEEWEGLPLQQTPPGDHNEEFMEYTEVLPLIELTEEEKETKGYPLLAKDSCTLYEKQGPDELGFGELALTLAVKKTEVDFEANLSSVLNDDSMVEFAMVVTISDESNGKYFAAQMDSFSMSTGTNSIEGTFDQLESDHLYEVQVIVLAKTESGSLTSEPFYVTKTLKTL